MPGEDKQLAQMLEAESYTLSRINPSPEDGLYLHLSDLRQALDRVATSEEIRMLDYGCGGCPYRGLFPNALYHRADFTEVAGLDFKIGEDSLLGGVEDAYYDRVLSTQVLEHVQNPQRYLGEAHRILRRGGDFVVTTHGCFHDHGCPHDYYRWTADGLRLALEREGFLIESLCKLTTNARAVISLGEHYLGGIFGSRLSKPGFAWWIFRELFWKNRVGRNRWLDERMAANRVVDAQVPGHEIYIGLMAVARKGA